MLKRVQLKEGSLGCGWSIVASADEDQLVVAVFIRRRRQQNLPVGLAHAIGGQGLQARCLHGNQHLIDRSESLPLFDRLELITNDFSFINGRRDLPPAGPEPP